jgi:coniferyl-aldehyde dehydrogenase
MTIDMLRILREQRRAFDLELPVSLDVRQDRLRRLGEMVAANADRFADAMAQDFGHRSRIQSLMTDVVASLSAVKHNRDHVARWMRPEKRRMQFPLGLLGSRAWIEYQPKGVVGVIAPWNFPVQLTVGPIAGAFAAGNRVMAKTSEATPATSAIFVEAASQWFDAMELAIFTGGPEVGEQFAGLPLDHLIFTGGTAIGRHVLRAAAENLVPVTLELGGKSPAIVGRSADLAKAAVRIATGKMLNAGQICIAPDYALVPEESERTFVKSMQAAVSAMYPALLANEDYTSLINERQHVRITGYLDDARAKGAEVIEINPGDEDFSRTNSHKMPLHIVLGVTDEMALMREEIFGPVLPVRRYKTIDDAVSHVNAGPRPLALYYFGSDERERRTVLDRTVSGGVTIDDVLFHVGIDDLPFGGVGPSGMGSYHGVEGFRTFSHAKAIYKQGPVDLAKLGGMRPPYGKTARSMIDRGLKGWLGK